MNEIRKISVGMNYPDGVIHYQIGKTQRLNNKDYIIKSISIDTDLYRFDKIGYNIYLQDEYSTVLWKTIIGVPTVVEYNIDFE